MHTTRSASRAPSVSRSAAEAASTVSMPKARHALITRTAISPRFATRTRASMSGRIDHEERIIIFDHLAVLGADPHDAAVDPGLHGGEELHDLDETDRRVRFDSLADL